MAAIPIRTFEVLGMHAKCERDKVGRAEIISGNPLQDRADQGYGHLKETEDEEQAWYFGACM